MASKDLSVRIQIAASAWRNDGGVTPGCDALDAQQVAEGRSVEVFINSYITRYMVVKQDKKAGKAVRRDTRAWIILK